MTNSVLFSVDRKTKKTSEQEVCYITNTTPTCEEANKVIRNHWRCELAHYILEIRNGQGNEVFKAERFLANNIKVFKHLLEEPTPLISA